MGLATCLGGDLIQEVLACRATQLVGDLREVLHIGQQRVVQAHHCWGPMPPLPLPLQQNTPKRSTQRTIPVSMMTLMISMMLLRSQLWLEAGLTSELRAQ